MQYRTRGYFAVLALFALAGCGEEQTSQSGGERSGADYPPDRVITGTVPDPDIDRDPTPQTTTGGEIPGGGAAGADEEQH